MKQATDKEVLQIIKDGTRRLVEHAKSKWISDEYKTDEAMRQAQLERWRDIDQRARTLINTITTIGE